MKTVRIKLNSFFKPVKVKGRLLSIFFHNLIRVRIESNDQNGLRRITKYDRDNMLDRVTLSFYLKPYAKEYKLSGHGDVTLTLLDEGEEYNDPFIEQKRWQSAFN